MTSTGDGARKALADRLDEHAIRYANDYGYGVASDLKKAAAFVRALRAPSSGTVTRTDGIPIEVVRELTPLEERLVNKSLIDSATRILSLPSPAVELREANDTARKIIAQARAVYENHRGDGAWIAMEKSYHGQIVAALAFLSAKSLGDTPLDARTVEVLTDLTEDQRRVLLAFGSYPIYGPQTFISALRCAFVELEQLGLIGQSKEYCLTDAGRALLREDQGTAVTRPNRGEGT